MKALRDLTIDDVYKMESGRELDICVAEFMTGQDRLTCRVDPMNRDGEPQFYYGHPPGHDFAPNYSTEKEVAFLIVTSMLGKKMIFECNAHCIDSNSRWHVSFNHKFFSLASTIEVGICKAALLYYLNQRRQ